MIILHHINEEQYKDAIENLNNILNDQCKINEIIYRYCHVFIRHEPGN